MTNPTTHATTDASQARAGAEGGTPGLGLAGPAEPGERPDQAACQGARLSAGPSCPRPMAAPGRPSLGAVEFFRPGEHERVERALADLKLLGIKRLRTCLSWADHHRPDGPAWHDWLIPRLAREVEVLPCFTYTPPSLGLEPKSSSPPRRTRDYADFLDAMATRLGRHFEYVELWNEPNNLNDWDYMADPGWRMFAAMIGDAAHWMRHLGKKTVLAGTCPSDPGWLQLMCGQGVMDHIDVVGLHAFPDTWDFDFKGWEVLVSAARNALAGLGHSPALWITEAGYSTWRLDELNQARAFEEALKAPVERVYWYALHDLDPEIPTQEGLHADERHYHMGLATAEGRPKLLGRLLVEGGPDQVRQLIEVCSPNGRKPGRARTPRPALITGGAGFIGANLADRLLAQGRPVIVMDNLARPGVERNLAWLKARHGNKVEPLVADVRDRQALRQALGQVDHFFHLAGQVAVTLSIKEPLWDFEVNVGGTLGLLEEMRRLKNPPSLVFASTNKVYGNLEDIGLKVNCTRYQPRDERVKRFGVDETRPLDFHSPYGCSKGAADAYVTDYARTFGLPCVVFRMSCIYGPRQFGTEDQGWVAHFLIRSLKGLPLTLYGDGKQVRDLLFVDDLLDAYLLAQERIDLLSGQAFNIGGGPANTSSLVELLAWIDSELGSRPNIRHDAWRKGDQPYYVSDHRRFSALTGWTPKTPFPEGLKLLKDWAERLQKLGAEA